MVLSLKDSTSTKQASKKCMLVLNFLRTSSFSLWEEEKIWYYHYYFLFFLLYKKSKGDSKNFSRYYPTPSLCQIILIPDLKVKKNNLISVAPSTLYIFTVWVISISIAIENILILFVKEVNQNRFLKGKNKFWFNKTLPYKVT